MIYHYNGGELEYEEHFNSSDVLQEVLKYSYDTNGMVEYLLYKDDNFSNANAFDLYYYVRNAVDDITYLFQVREQNGSSTTEVNRLVAHYEYDPYGNILNIEKFNNDDIGDINPIRYKDYYYDAQTGWYQLTSRFYDPEVGRFLNADEYVATGQDISGNMYAYCGNNPVNRCDPSGALWKEIGNFFKSVGTAIVNIVKKTVGATFSESSPKGKPRSQPIMAPFLCTTSTNISQKIASYGNPSALITQNITHNTLHPISSSFMNTTITISRNSVGFNLGLDNTGIVFKTTNDGVSTSYGVKLNVSEQQCAYVTTYETIRGDTTSINSVENGFDSTGILVGAGYVLCGVVLFLAAGLTPAYS